jgi:hypothetical protein
VSFSYHLSKILNENHVLKIKETFKGGGQFYGDIQYKNIKKNAIHNFQKPIILAVDKAHYQYLKYFKDAIIIIHDPTELSFEVIEFAKKNKVITIREIVHELLKKNGIKNIFLKHPFYKYPKINLEKKYNRSLSRVDFDKNTDIICKANNLGANVEIYGYKNHIYYFHKLKELNFDKYYKGYYSKNLRDISKLYAETRFLIDMSTIKNDGGGTQYTFLEAEYHGCSLILNKNWCNVKNSLYINGINCYSVSDEKELLKALHQKPIYSNLIPNEIENNLWKEILI